MEKTISSQERIKRAKELYSRRKMNSEELKRQCLNTNTKEKINLRII